MLEAFGTDLASRDALVVLGPRPDTARKVRA